MMPSVSASGVWLAASSGTVVCGSDRAGRSKCDRAPYGLTGAPSARGSIGGVSFDRHAASAPPQAAATLRNQRRELSVIDGAL